MPDRTLDPRNKITFEVEGVAFTVDRQSFEVSEIFSDMFTLPASDEGKSLEKPVHLWGIAVCDFAAFLDALHFPDLEEGIPLSVEEWKGVLRLAHMWCFDRTMALAIQFLDKLLDDASKIELSLVYDYKPWYYPSLRRLAERREDLTTQEVERVGWDVARGIQAVREVFSKRSLQDLERSGVAETVNRATLPRVQAIHSSL